MATIKDKKISALFYSLAQLASDAGMEFSLSLTDDESENKTLNGVIAHSRSKINGLTLHCWWPEPAAAEDGETEESEAGEDDGEN